jgi:hypothetical protein
MEKELIQLEVTIEGKVHLWLTFKGLKKVSTVQFLPDTKPSGIENVFIWINSNGLFYAKDHKSSSFIFVSKEKKLAERAAVIMWSEEEKDILEKGDLFGYPKEAARAFSLKENLAVVTPHNYKEYWAPYVRYLVREGNVDSDSMIAKEWADEVRSGVPNLADIFEREIALMKVK